MGRGHELRSQHGRRPIHEPGARQWRPLESMASRPHEAFALAFRPGERLFHRFALIVTQAHFRQRGLYVDLLRDLWRRWRGRNRQLLMVIGVWIVIERTLRRPLLLP